MVSTAESIHSASPVASVNVRSSKMRSADSMPYSPTTMSWIFRAISSFRSRVLAMPIGSIVNATSAAPCFFARGTILSIRSRPFSMLMELMIARPGMASSAFSITLASVESIMIGDSTDIESSLTSLAICSGSSARSVTATQTSRTWAPDSACSRATSTMPS